jgi:outer membrane lipoprotein-sorting protein
LRTPRVKQGFTRCVFLVVTPFLILTTANAAPKNAQAISAAAPAGWNASLESVLTLMDKTAEQFRSAEANLTWDSYQKVIDETDTQKGKIYFRRSAKEVQMSADITDPAPESKSLLFSGNKIQIFQPHANIIDVYSTEKNQEAFESFLLLGFGGGGHSMQKSFDMKYLGTETLPDGTSTAKLELVPKSEKIRNNFDRFVLWIDARGISVQQQIFTGSDYKMQKYTDIKLNQKLPDNAFTLKKNGNTKTIMHE